MKYIPAKKLIAEITRIYNEHQCRSTERYEDGIDDGYHDCCDEIVAVITSLQQEQPVNMIQWTGSNLQEVINFTGKSPKFGEWFKSWDEFESYVHSHGDILKLFPRLRRSWGASALWSKSYFCESVGYISQNTVRRYIANQKLNR